MWDTYVQTRLVNGHGTVLSLSTSAFIVRMHALNKYTNSVLVNLIQLGVM